MKKIFFLVFIAILIVFSVTRCYQNENSAQEIYMKDFKLMLANKDVEKVEIVNKTIVNVYLNPGKLEYYKKIVKKDFSKTLAEGSHFTIRIGDQATFENSLKEFQVNVPENEKIYSSSKEDKNYIIDFVFSFWMPILLLLPFIFWLIFLIDILKSDFKNSIDKLIWILIITFIPIIGLILYPFIGKKQRIKMPKN